MIRNSRRVAALAVAGAVAVAPVISGCGAGQEPQTVAPTQLTEGVNAALPRTGTKIDIRNMFLLGPKPEQRLDPGAKVPLYASIINQQDKADRLVSVTAAGFGGSAKITGGALALPAADPDGRGSLTNLLGTARPAATTESPSPGTTASPKHKVKTSETPTGTPSATPGEDSGQPPAGGQPETTPQPGAKAPLVVLTGLTSPLIGGETLKVTLVFQNAGQISVTVPVIPQQGEYASYTAVSQSAPKEGVPTGTPSPGETPTQTGHNGGPGTPGSNNEAPEGSGGND
ncbi:hypothetical protein [Actinomadura atramentaria]|uniref:hypothetical protein n=1 Tax=Actinomadura atramentaria TaxID=1990 RepID=UPI0003A88808|nr:hypothetical protein [Actinomadura atramentaria]